MKKQLLLSMLIMLLSIGHHAWSQSQTVTGLVTSASDGSPLPGVNVLVKGTNAGTTTNADGRYSISAPANGTLTFSFIGFSAQDVPVNNRATIDVQLSEDITNLSEVVITAIGIERGKESLGYAVQSVQGENLSQKSTNDVFQSLQGKVAGLNITQSSGAPGAGSTILIRGATSLSSSGRNSPLIVVDGMPIDNEIIGTDAGSGSAVVFGTAAFGNRGQDLNPEDIESVTVLKGPSASALYGIRAANGAIIITTKRGTRDQRLTATVTSSYSLSRVNIFPNFQNDYGQGLGFRHSSPFSSNSWGRRFGAIPNDSITDHNGDRVPYRAYPNNVRDFFQNGYLFNNNIQLSGGTENSSIILSVGRTDQRGIVPNSQLERTNIRLAGSTNMARGLNIEGSLQYINTQVLGSPQGNSGSSVFFLLPSIPRSYDFQGRPVTNPDGSQNFYSSNDHPLWSAMNNPATSRVNRFIGTTGLRYQIFNWLSASYKVGFDVYNDFRKEVYSQGSARFSGGQITDDNLSYESLESNLLLNIDHRINDQFTLTGTLGHNLNSTRRDRFIVTGSGISTPGINNVLNTEQVTVDSRNGTVFNRRLIGVFAEATLGYRDYLFLTLSGRNDWSSTLPVENRSFFYPNAALAFTFSEALGISNDVFSYGKVRASWARVGNDAQPFYTIPNVYVVPSYGNNVANINFPFGGIAGFTLANRRGNNRLKPESTTGIEFGTVLGFFKDRITIDATYYDQRTDDQILFLQVPASSGFEEYVTNAGTITNKGVEILVNANVLKRTHFNWNATLNFARNRNKVLKLAEGLQQTQLEGFTGIGSFAKVGEPLGVFLGGSFARDTLTGEFLVLATGVNRGTLLPGDPERVMGNPNPDFTASLINNFTYRGIRLGIQFDMQKGGDVFSNTASFVTELGSAKHTGVDREKPRIIPGVLANAAGEPVLDDQGNRISNNIQIDAQTYWRSVGSSFTEGSVLDASYIRLREITLGYTLPQSLMKTTPFSTVDISFSARNLWTYAPNLRGIIDPESANAAGALARGLELNSTPGVANYGVNLRLTF